MDKQQIIEAIEAIIGDVSKAHTGIMCARSLQLSMKEMIGLPFFPEKTMPISDGFEAANAAHSALKSLIKRIENV